MESDVLSKNTSVSESDDPSIVSLSFEKALEELESIVKDLETGRASLEDSINAYARGVALRKHCERRLQEAQLKIEQISVDSQGTLTTTAFAHGE